MSDTGSLKDAAKRPPRWPRWMLTNVVVWRQLFRRSPRPSLRPRWRSPSVLAVTTAVGIVAVIGAMVFVDAIAITAVRGLPPVYNHVFNEITDFGLSSWWLVPSGFVLVAIAAIASPALTRMSRLVLAAVAVRFGFLFVAIAAPGLTVSILKRIVGRGRPFIGGTADPYHFMTLVWRPDYASLPSGHATTAFAALVAVGALWPRLRPLMWAYALVIGASRVIVLAHHPSDVIAGACVGAFGALLLRDWFAARRLGFKVDTEGRVATMPGPTFARIKKVARALAAP